jgi:ABC-type glycerol-3-phosphate transport system substrate-binding protein
MRLCEKRAGKMIGMTGPGKWRGRMKNHSKVLFAGVLALLMASATSCMTADSGGGVVANFIKIVSVDWSYQSSQDGAQLLLRNLVLQFANDTGDDAEATIAVDWGDNKTEKSTVSLRDTGGTEYTDAVWPDNDHGHHYYFHGETAVTFKITIEFLETVSPVFEKTVTLRSL